MNRETDKVSRDDGYPEVIGQNVAFLLEEIDSQVLEGEFRARLKESLKQLADLKTALDESSIVAVTDSRGVILYVNDRFCEISQYGRDELIGKDHRVINSGFHSKTFIREMWRTIGSGKIWRGEIRNRAKDGSYYWVNTTIMPFIGSNGKPYQYMAVRSEVTKLKETEEELQQMMSKVMHIQEEERRRISRELHDGIGQSLFSLQIQLDRMISEHQLTELQALRKDVSGMMDDVRNLAWELRPSVLDDLGVVPAIRTYIDNYSQHYGMQVDLACSLRTRLDVQRETVLYRVIQEALTNVAKYAGVSEVTVSVTETAETVQARISDSGTGFIRDRSGKGVGLFSMEERARSVGAALSIRSEPGAGTVVELSVPKRTAQ
ncbi:PAS domain S-box protein [Paenibacillus sp. NPDC058071]|uniref:PAS domain-containing sensor histidine kinase n=1 Tax=Paenibacillus sp. NPDC058071 TaxID=3346326 RepID=UPI0036DBF547